MVVDEVQQYVFGGFEVYVGTVLCFVCNDVFGMCEKINIKKIIADFLGRYLHTFIRVVLVVMFCEHK